jgi:NAD(P)-dependent dehydrogenase (short-subunit alcohol dehydrogenase family)
MTQRAYPNLMMSPPDLSGQVALVTGGGRGLGRAFAEGLAAAGAAVAVVGRSADSLEETVRRIAAAGGCAIPVAADVTRIDSVSSMVQAVQKRFGAVDLLVNNAGTNRPVGRVWEVDPEQWWHCIESNLRGPFLCSRAVIPNMIERGGGRIINVGSTAGMRPLPYCSAYSTSKAALSRLTETLAAETKPYGIKVFAIHPGLVRTGMTEYLAESPAGRYSVPWVGRVLSAGEDDPPEVAVNLVLLLSSGCADSLSGRFLSAYDDLISLVERQAEIEKEDWYTMRLRVPPA